jgi:AcrR family transcriptional regulator
MKQQRSKDTVRKMLNAAIELFVKEGYHGASIADIADATGLTKGAIYFHFESKDALMAAILEEFEKLYLDRMIAEVEAKDGNALDKIKHYLKFTVNFFPRQLNLCFTHLATELNAGGKKPGGIDRIYKRYHDFLARILEQGRKEGTLRDDFDPDILALNLIGALEGNLIQWKFNMRKYRGDDFAGSFVKFYLYGIEKPKKGKRGPVSA